MGKMATLGRVSAGSAPMECFAQTHAELMAKSWGLRAK